MRTLKSNELSQVVGGGFWSDLGRALGRIKREFDDDMKKIDNSTNDTKLPESHYPI